MITQEFLSRVAAYAAHEIAKVVLNDTHEITTFDLKRADGTTVTVNYLVRAADVSQINRIALMTADGTVVSTNDVDVPITADTLMVQTINFGEVA